MANLVTENPTHTRGLGGPRKRIHWLPYMIVLPILLYEGILIVFPILQGIYGSFTRIELASRTAPAWVGFANYERMFRDPVSVTKYSPVAISRDDEDNPDKTHVKEDI